MNANTGKIQVGLDELPHPGFPHMKVSMTLAGGTAFVAGSILQPDANGELVVGDLSKRSYVAAQDIAADDEVALVIAIGAIPADRLLLNGTALTPVQRVALMANTPIVVV